MEKYPDDQPLPIDPVEPDDFKVTKELLRVCVPCEHVWIVDPRPE